MGRIISIKRGLEMRQARGEIPPPEPERWRLSIGAMVLIFTAVAVAMTGAAVLMGASDWGDTLALVLLVSVVALIKVALANFVFFALMRADQEPDRRIPVEDVPPDPPAHREPSKVIKMHTFARGRRVLRPAEIAVPAAATLAADAEPARRVIPSPRRPT